MLPGPTLIQMRAPLISRPMIGRSGATSSKTPRSAQVHLNRASAVRSRGTTMVAANAPAAMIDQESCWKRRSDASRWTRTSPIAVSPAAIGKSSWSPRNRMLTRKTWRATIRTRKTRGTTTAAGLNDEVSVASTATKPVSASAATHASSESSVNRPRPSRTVASARITVRA